MLLRKISLKGFLSYYGCKDENGEVKPVEIDLSAAPLWLIYGPNGSGKSALFDAITFALYKKHRASGRDVGQRFHYLVHDAAKEDKAEINLEIDLNGQRYLIQRTITRTVRKKNGEEEIRSSVWGIIRRWPGSDKPYDKWPALPNTTNKVEDWVNKNLRMSSDTFTSAVVLRQGEADAFLNAAPASRKKRLLELLDLQFYEKLGQAANQKKSSWNKELSRLQDELNLLQEITEEDLLAKKSSISEMESDLDTAKNLLQLKTTELDNAKLFLKLSGEIDEKEQQQRQDDQLMQRAETILANVRRYRELDKVLVMLDVLWSARKRVAAQQEDIEEKSAAIKKLQTDQAKLTPHLQKAQEDEKTANKILEVKNDELTQALERQRILKGKLGELEQIKKLEQQIDEAEERFRPHKKILSEANKIEQKYQRYESLRDTILPVLRPLKDAEKHLQEMQEKFKTAEETLKEWKEKVGEAKGKEEVRKQEAKDKKLACDEVNQFLTDFEKTISLLGQKLDDRENISDQAECPICGSRLDDEKTQARLANERSHWQQEIEELEDKKQQFRAELKLKEQEEQDAQGELKKAQALTRKLEIELAGYQKSVEHHEESLHRAKHAVDVTKEKAGNWFGQLEQLNNLEAEFISLKGSSQEWKDLQEAQQAKSAAQATFDACEIQLNRLPQWTTGERQQIKLDCEEIDQKVLVYQQSKTDAEKEAKGKKSQREGLEEQQQKLKNELAIAKNDLKNLGQNKQQAEEEIEQQQQKLPPTWIGHPACSKELALNELHKEHNGLSNAEEEESQLQQAQQRVTGLAGAIDALKTHCETIPFQHRRPVVDVQAEWNTTDTNVKRCEEELGKERENLGKMREQKNTYEERRIKRDKAAKELSYYKRLADAFGGRKGLRAKIVQAAQEAIKANANSTLGRLSNGVWQVELLEDTKGDELEILARDTSQPGMPLRPFEYISGGERFRVAISLAVAIGQSISGGRTVDTLVIDEGFGSLDEVNRDLLVDELQRLSRDVLQGGRVVVVSHQEDVCEKFGNRYHISKDSDGRAQVQPHRT